MKNKKTFLALGVLLLFSGWATADLGSACNKSDDCGDYSLICRNGSCDIRGILGDPCTSPCDCQSNLACHNGNCTQNCYAHSECSEWGLSDYCRTLIRDEVGYCGPLNTCVPSIPPGGTCNASNVCPGCRCAPEVCSFGDETYPFIDNLDNNRFYCGWGDPDTCFHLGVEYSMNGFVYLPDKQNAYYCNGWSWGDPACSEGYVWNITKYPVVAVYHCLNGCDSPLPTDGCIPWPTGACCHYGNPTLCENTNAHDCGLAGSGIFFQGTTCSANLCSDPTCILNINHAMEFDGIDDYVEIPDNGLFNPTSIS